MKLFSKSSRILSNLFYTARISSIIFLCCICFSANAQFYQFINYNVKDGLPSSDVYAMLQDSDGFIWFTTDMGVSRFDGYHFKTFSSEDGLADNTNFGIVQDSKSRIWFYSFSGKLSYFLNEKINTIPCNTEIAPLFIRHLITSLYVDTGDTIWCGYGCDSLLKIAPPWGKANFQVIPFKNKGPYLVQFPDKHFIHGGTTQYVDELSVYNSSLKKLYSVPFQIISPNRNSIRFKFTALSDDSYLMTSDNLISRFNSKGLISQIKENSTNICHLEEKDRSILIGGYGGVHHFSDFTFNNSTVENFFNNKIVTSILKDNENGIWYCTEGNGVYYLPFRNFLYYTPENGLSESKIACVANAGNTVICGHLDGSWSILNNQSVKSFNCNPDERAIKTSVRITSILPVDAENIYISTTLNIFSFNLHDFSVKPKLGVGTKAMVASKANTFWSLVFRTLIKNKIGNSITEIKRIAVNTYTDNIYEDRSGRIWLCPTNSVYIYDSTNGLIDFGKNNPLMNTRMVDFQEDKDGNMWMVSRGKGVIIKKGNSYLNITQKEGLAGNMCRTLFIDSSNVVWVGTNNGLSKIVVAQGEEFRYIVNNYTSKNGLLTNEVNDIIQKNNKLWLIHNNGISIFDPKIIRDNDIPPPVYITNVNFNEDTVSLNEISKLEYNQNYFNISFIGLSYKDPGNLEYRYKLEGVDSNWNYTNYTSIKYQTLPSGKYRFVVFAKNNDGFWSKKPATFSFVIFPAWWQTWTFTIGLIIFIALIAFWIFRYRLLSIRNRDQKKSQLQNRIAGIELNALRAQMNPHFVFNAINSVQYFITNNDPDSSQKYLSKFARLIRYVVDNSKLTSIPIKKEIEALTLYLDIEALRFGKHFEYTINVNPNVDVEYAQIPSMLIQPYVENSIWHGIMHKEGIGKIEISMEMKGEILYCIVEDNGIGRTKSKELKKDKEELHKSVGMSNTKERLEIINQVNKSNMSVAISDVLNNKNEICGTKVEIHIPIS